MDDATKNIAEIIGKIFLGAVAVCYVIGLAVVNIYLNNYGIYILSLLHLSYISAGIWALIQILVPMSIILLFLLHSEVHSRAF